MSALPIEGRMLDCDGHLYMPKRFNGRDLGTDRPEVLVHPDDARAAGIGTNDVVEVASETGRLRIAARVTDAIPRGVVSISHGWAEANVNVLISSRDLDPLTGMGLDRVPHDLVVPHQRRGHRVRMLLPQARRTFEVGEQEGDRPRRQLRHNPSVPFGQPDRYTSLARPSTTASPRARRTVQRAHSRDCCVALERDRGSALRSSFLLRRAHQRPVRRATQSAFPLVTKIPWLSEPTTKCNAEEGSGGGTAPHVLPSADT